MKNIFYLVGFPSSGKTFYLKKLKKFLIKENDYLFFDQDEEICKKYNVKDINSFFKSQNKNSQFYFDEINIEINKIAKLNPNKKIIVSTGAYSLFFNKKKYKQNLIYIFKKKKELFNSLKKRKIEQNKKIEDTYLIFDYYKELDYIKFLKFSEKNFKNYYLKHHFIFIKNSELFINNNNYKNINKNLIIILNFIKNKI